ncbi:hypothetical protein [uncultured Methylobacterium sp.]|uniref:hypothetical protein n=1 Tax=uncultured Methylobacterium sp. TaxID=157278 RepID=UPI0035CC15A5
MARSFTVIQGGRRAADATMAVDPAPSGNAWQVDLHRAGTVDDEAVDAWRALLTRNAVADPQADPDYLLSAARHQAKGRRIAFALAWDRDADGREALRGVLPLAMPHPVWGRGRARPWHPPGLPEPAALIDGRHADAVETAIRGRLAALRRPLRLEAPPRCPVRADAPRPVLAVLPAERRARIVPADRLVGVRPDGYAAAHAVEHVSDPMRITAAVEAFLVLDARHAVLPIIADPSEASMVRVVTRLFARRGQMRVELARRAGEIVAATLHLGAGARAVAWRHAAGA